MEFFTADQLKHPTFQTFLEVQKSDIYRSALSGYWSYPVASISHLLVDLVFFLQEKGYVTKRVKIYIDEARETRANALNSGICVGIPPIWKEVEILAVSVDPKYLPNDEKDPRPKPQQPKSKSTNDLADCDVGLAALFR